MTGSQVSACPGCGLVLPVKAGPTHPYLRSSAACWARYGELLAREFTDPEYFRVHQLTVDAYAVQHPGGRDRRSIQSLAVHLMTLCLVLEDGADPGAGPGLHKRFAKHPSLHWLERPDQTGDITVADVLRAANAAEHRRIVEAWARQVWEAWTEHHATVRAWIAEAFARPGRAV